MAVQLTYTGTPFAEQIKQQGFKAGNPTGGFSTRLADLFQRGPKTFTTPNIGVASLYGKTIPVVSSMSNLRLPSGAIPGKTFLESLKNLGGTRFGTEVIQTPKQATKGMDLASKLGTKYTGPTAAKLLAGKTVSGFGGVTPSLASKALNFTKASLFNPFGLALGAGQGIGFLADQATRAMNTPEAYEFITNVTKNDPFAFDETNMDVGNIFTQQALLNNPENKQLQELVAQGGGYNIPGITDRTTESLPPDVVLNEFDNITNTGVNQDRRGIIDLIKSGGQKVLDFAAPIAKDVAGRSIASQALGKAGFMVGGIPGALAGMIFGGAKGGDLFDAPYIGGVTTFDPITGELISGEELDKLNARGGYYTDVARAARRRDRSIANMRARRDAGLTYGANRLKELEEQAAKEEAARQAEFDRIMSSEQSQQDFYDSLNEGRGATSTAESRATAGDAPGYSGPSPFAKGGIVGLL